MKVTLLSIALLFIYIQLSAQCAIGDPSTNISDYNTALSIEDNFNNARRWEEMNRGLTTNCLGNMVAPSGGWGSLTSEGIIFYIHNSEREARGLLPLTGVETNLSDVSQNHSTWQAQNGVFSHSGDPALGTSRTYTTCTDCGTSVSGSSPSQRINSNASLINKWQYVSENLYLAVNTAFNFPAPEAKSMYNFMYKDASSAWGHRHAILHEYINNWGDTGNEGFIGVGISIAANFKSCLYSCVGYAGDVNGWDYAIIITIDYIDPLSTATGFSFANILPVELLSFTAKAEDDKVAINWATSTEINSDYFVVERSKDGVHFEALETVKAAGYSYDQIDYTTVDYSPNEGINYYRIQQVDLDGKTEYSEVISVEIENKTVVSISPNPFSDFIAVKGIDSRKESFIQIFDIKGQLVYTNGFAAYSNAIELYPTELDAGIYFMEITQNNRREIIKIVKE